MESKKGRYISLNSEDEFNDGRDLTMQLRPADLALFSVSISRRRRALLLIAVSIGLVLVLGTAAAKHDRVLGKFRTQRPSEDGDRSWEDISDFVLSKNATNTFRENLVPGVKYLTTWNSAGMTNVLEGYVNLIYLAMLADRVAVVPPLAPSVSHLGRVPLPFLNFGDVFDLPRLQEAIRSPVIQWSDLKRATYGVPWTWELPHLEGTVEEELGCWSSSQVVRSKMPHRTQLEGLLYLDVAYTPVPTYVSLGGKWPDHYNFWGLANLLFPHGRAEALHQTDVKPGQTLHSKKEIAPDDMFACFDEMYYAGVVHGYEWEYDVSPAWRLVGRYVHFTERVETLAVNLLKKTLGVPESHDVPPFFAIHIRRDDFDAPICAKNPEMECHPPLSVFANRIKDIEAELQERYGSVSALGNVRDVIVTSDEKNATWWKGVENMGWLYIDHAGERTSERYGRWFPAIIDSVIQSKSIGFVGTGRSTMSRVAALRVRDWNGGISRMVRWDHGHEAK